MRSSLASVAAGAREPDPERARTAAAEAWHKHGLILLNVEWLPSWADKKQAELLAEKAHGRRRSG